MEEQVTIDVQEQEPVQQDPPKKKLWKSLNTDKLYTKSYEEFEKQFSTPESISKLHQTLSNDHLYTKGESEFNKQFFSDIKPSKKKVSTVAFGESYSSPELDSETPSTSKIPTVNDYGDGELIPNNPVDLAKKAFEYAKKTKQVERTSMGGNPIVETVDDKDAQGISKKILDDLEKEGIGKDFIGAISDLPDEAFNDPNTSKEALVDLYKNNRIKFHQVVNEQKNRIAIKRGAFENQKNANNGIDDIDPNQMAIHVANKYLGTYEEAHPQNLNQLQNIISKKQDIIEHSLIGEERTKALDRVRESYSSYINPTNPDIQAEYEQSPLKNKVDITQYSALKTLQLFDAKKYEQAVNILNTDIQKQYTFKPEFENFQSPVAASPSVTTSDSTLAAKNKGSLSSETIDQQIGKESVLRQLTELGRNNLVTQINSQQYDLEQAFNNTDNAEEKEAIKQQYVLNQGKLAEVSKNASQDKIKFPLTSKLEFDNQVKELVQDAGMGAIEYGTNKFAHGVGIGGESFEDMAVSIFGSEKDKALLGMKRIGESKWFESKTYLPEDYRSTGSPFIMQPSPALKDAAKEIMGGKKLSDLSADQKQQLAELVANNQSQIETVTNPKAGKSKNFFSKATLYSNTGFIGEVGAFMYKIMGAKSLGLSGKSAELLTLYNDGYSASHNEKLKEGASAEEANQYGVLHGGVMLLAGTVSSKFDAVKDMLAASKSPISKQILGLGEAGWDAIVNKNKSTISKIANGVSDVVKSNAKMIGTYGVGVSIASDLADKGFFNKDISVSEMADNVKHSAIDMAIGSVGLAGIGFISHAIKNPVTLKDKATIWEIGDNPELSKIRIDESVAKNELTQAEGDTKKKAIDNISSLIGKVPTENSKGKPLTDKQRVEFLYNSILKEKGKEAAKDLPDTQSEKAEHLALVADHANGIILENPTEKQLNDRKASLERKLEPKKDAEGKVIEIPEKEKKNYEAELQAVTDAIEHKKSFDNSIKLERRNLQEQKGNPEEISQPIELSIETTDPIEQHLDKGALSGIKNAEDAYKLIAEQAQGISKGEKLNGDAFTQMEEAYGKKIVDAAIEKYPAEKLLNEQPSSTVSSEGVSGSALKDAPKFEIGKPIVVFHGTTQNFETFDAGKRGSATHDEDTQFGTFFSDTHDEANKYTKGNGRVIKAELNLKNPLVVDVQKIGGNKIELIKKAIADGHDGIVFENILTGKNKETGEWNKHTEYIVFNNDAIKILDHNHSKAPTQYTEAATPPKKETSGVSGSALKDVEDFEIIGRPSLEKKINSIGEAPNLEQIRGEDVAKQKKEHDDKMAIVDKVKGMSEKEYQQYYNETNPDNLPSHPLGLRGTKQATLAQFEGEFKPTDYEVSDAKKKHGEKILDAIGSIDNVTEHLTEKNQLTPEKQNALSNQRKKLEKQLNDIGIELYSPKKNAPLEIGKVKVVESDKSGSDNVVEVVRLGLIDKKTGQVIKEAEVITGKAPTQYTEAATPKKESGGVSGSALKDESGGFNPGVIKRPSVLNTEQAADRWVEGNVQNETGQKRIDRLNELTELINNDKRISDADKKLSLDAINRALQKAKAPTQYTEAATPKPTVSSEVDFTAKGGNKVVDDKGEPITVYHTTNAENIGEFKTSGEIETLAGKVKNEGAYFTPNKGEYAHKGGNEHEVQISIKNPYITTDQIESAIISPEKKADLISKGHDGVILMRNGKPAEYIVFDKSQIKSAEQPKSENKPIQNESKANEVQQSAEVKEPATTEPNKEIESAGEGTGGKEPPNKDFDKMTSNIPSSGEVKKYLSGETILENQPNTELRNPQEYVELKLNEALKHGVETIEKAKEIFGNEYVEKTLEYIEKNNLPIENKSLLYVTLENEMAKRVAAEPNNVGLKKIEDLVRSKSQAFLRSNSKAINMGRLRAFAKTGFDISKITDKFFSSKELEQKAEIEKAVQADAETIQKQYEESKQEVSGFSEADIEAKVKEGIESEIDKIYEALPKEKKTAVDKAISALDKIHEKLKNKTYSDATGMTALVDAGVVTIRAALKAGATAAKAVELGIAKIKKAYEEKYGKKWEKEDEFRKDYLDGLKEQGVIDAQQRRQAKKEYQMLETERNRQLAKVADLTEKLSTLQKGERPTINTKEAKPDVPEIEALKAKVKEETQKLNALDAQQRRIDGLETELDRLQNRLPKEKSETVKRQISDKEQELKGKIETEKEIIRKESKENNQLRLSDAKDAVRQRIEKIKTEIANKERELKEQNKPLNDDLELTRLHEVENQITELRDKYLPEEKDPYEAEKQRERVKDKLVADIIGLNDQINIGERNKKSDKPNYENDAEINKLKKIREDKKAILNEIDPLAVPKEKTTSERKVDAENNLQKKIDDIREEILNGEREVSKSKDKIQSKKLIQLREQKKALEALRDKYLPKGKDPYADNKAAKLVEDKLTKENIELNRQILKGEKDVKENKVSPESESIDKLKAERDARKEILEAIDPTPKEFVQNALIEQGFGKTVKIKTKNGVEERQVLDWKKLAGEEGSVDKISDNVGKVLEKNGFTPEQLGRMSDAFIKEYTDLRASVIEKGLNEMAARNKTTVSPLQKSAAKKLAEMYNYGLFDKDPVEYENALAKTIGVDKLNEGRVAKVRELGEAMAKLYSSSYQGKRLTESQMRTAIQVIEEKMRDILHAEANQHGSTRLKLANMARTYMDAAQRMTLNNLKQALENPLSGKWEKTFSSIGYTFGMPKELRQQRRKAAAQLYKEMVLQKGIGYGNVSSTFVNKGNLEMHINKMSDNQLFHAVSSTLLGRTTLDAVDSFYKSKITQQKFAYNLVKILTKDRLIDGKIEKGMSKEDAKKYVAEKLTGQSFEDAQKTAKSIIDKANAGKEKKIFNDSPEFTDRLAGDIVTAALVNGEKITEEMVTAAYNAAYKAAGRGLGHVANNQLSKAIGTTTGEIESRINDAIKEKDYNKAAALTLESILYRNIANPFVGGGTNWVVLKMEKTGLGLVSGLGSMMKKGAKMDLTSETGIKKLEQAMYENLKIKDKFLRGAIGGAVTALTALTMAGIMSTDEYRKWRSENMWAARYLDTVTPEVLLANMAAKDDKMKRYIESTLNQNEQFDKTKKIIKGAVSAFKGDKETATGQAGEVAGGIVGFPIPWRLVRDGQQILQGVSGDKVYSVDNRPSQGVMEGYFKGGFVDYLGYSPEGKYIGNDLSQPEFEYLKEKKAQIVPFNKHSLKPLDSEGKPIEVTEEKYKQFLEKREEYIKKEVRDLMDGKKHVLESTEVVEDEDGQQQDKPKWSILTKDQVDKITSDELKGFVMTATTRANEKAIHEVFGGRGNAPKDSGKRKIE